MPWLRIYSRLNLCFPTNFQLHQTNALKASCAEFPFPTSHPYHVNFWQLLNIYVWRLFVCWKKSYLRTLTLWFETRYVYLPYWLTWKHVPHDKRFSTSKLKCDLLQITSEVFVWRNFLAFTYSRSSFIVFALLFAFVVFSFHSNDYISMGKRWTKARSNISRSDVFKHFSLVFFQCCVENYKTHLNVRNDWRYKRKKRIKTSHSQNSNERAWNAAHASSLNEMFFYFKYMKIQNCLTFYSLPSFHTR